MTQRIDTNELHPQGDLGADSGTSELVHNLLKLARIAVYRRNTILQAVVVAALLGGAYYVLATRLYSSTAKLLVIERNQDQLASMADQPSSESTMATHRELVVSPAVIGDAIEHLLPEHRVDFHDRPAAEWNKAIADRLTAKTVRRTNFIEVGYRSVSPEAAAAVVSAIIQAYLDFVERTHKGSAGDVIQVLTQERDGLTRNLSVKQNELRAYRQRVGHLARSSEKGVAEPTIQRALKLNDALMEIHQRRLQLQASLATVQRAVENGDNLQQHLSALEESIGPQIMLSALGLSPQDAVLLRDQEQKLLEAREELRNLSPFLGPAHPKVTELTERVRSLEQYLASYRAGAGERLAALEGANLGPILVQSLKRSVAQAEQQEQQLQASFEEARAEAARKSGDLVQLEMLEREVARLETLHDVLFEKIATVDIRQLQAPIQATVVQEPLPDDVPESPQLRLVAVASLLCGLLVGGAMAYVQDVLDDRFASPEEMSAQLRVPMLAMVRRLDPPSGEGLASVPTFVSPGAVETEAFRTLRTALTLSAVATERVAVSSAEPGDGKTTVAANLAVSYAQAGKRTLIIDADLRKPGMTALLGLKGQPGVSDLLSANEPPAQLAPQWIRSTDQPGLDVLPAGLRRPNPAELLSGTNFIELLAWAESQYDQVLVDCPPVLAVSDAQIIGRLVDGAIVVVQPDKNHRQLVARACENFTTTGTSVLGVVANGLTPETARGYGYGYGYGYGSGYGYGHGEDPADAPTEDVLPERRLSDAADDRTTVPLGTQLGGGEPERREPGAIRPFSRVA